MRFKLLFFIRNKDSYTPYQEHITFDQAFLFFHIELIPKRKIASLNIVFWIINRASDPEK